MMMMWEALLDAVDEQCKVEDATRRKLAAETTIPRARGTRTRQ
jgi:hypothetical protein